MSRLVIALALAALVIDPVTTAQAGGRSHASGDADRGQKSERDPAPRAPEESTAYDPARASEVTTKVSSGAIRRVTSQDSSDATQIGLIRASLKRQAEQVANGVLPAPATAPPAGYSVLQAAAAGQLHAQYFEVRAGAEVRYSADDPMLVAALQMWVESLAAPPPATTQSIMRRAHGPD